jgi:flagellar basal body-associated protein FliL
MNVQDSESGFLVLMIISEIVITAIAFVGAYYIFKPFFKPNVKKEKNHSSTKKEESEE